MAKRLHKTLADYMVIGISPVLIMLLVGSLLFFLLTAFYHGQYGTRLTFIFAMFVMAVVLIARISMERGIEYASLFAIALAIVTGLAVMRFVQVDGALASFSTIINWSLIGLVWWSAHKLTWDCTLIDEQEDSSGEGLLQGMGFDEETVASQAEDVSKGGATEEAQPATESKDSSSPLWLQRMTDRRRRPHTPGTWVVYFSMAALPLFGLGQWFIPAGDTASRLRAFQLLGIYVASALGLLLTTSFLGLRRYLRQRHMQMPGDMAGVWLGAGALMIVVLLLFCILLPRPGAAVGISQLPFSFGSPDHRRTQKQAFGNDGPQQPERATGTRADATKPGKSAPTRSGAKQPSAADSRDSSAGKSATRAKSTERSGQRGQKSGGRSSARKSTNNRKQNDTAKGERDSTNDPAQGKSKTGDQSARQNRGTRQEKQTSSGESGRQGSDQKGEAQSAKDKQDGSAAERNPTGRKKQPSDQTQGTRKGTGGKQSESNQRDKSGPRFEREKDQSRSESARKSSADQRSSRQDNSPRSFSATKALGTVARGFGFLLKLAFFVLLACVVGFLAWKYRDQVAAAWRQLVEDLKNLWARLFGEPRAAVEANQPSSAETVREQARPFASYTDPFATGAADRYRTEQVVQYSFEALEAWARERGCPHEVEETPIEFAHNVATHQPQIGPEVHKLADLYCRVAYGRQQIPERHRNALARLWKRMRTSVPPEVPASP